MDDIKATLATPTTVLASSHKHPAESEHPSLVSTKHSHKITTAAAGLTDVASSVHDLATAFSASGASVGPTSPAHRAAAIKLIDKDDELSDNEQLQIFKVIHKDISVADLIFAMRNKGKRTRYIQSELSDLF